MPMLNRIELVSAHVPGSNKNIKSIIIFILHIEEIFILYILWIECAIIRAYEI